MNQFIYCFDENTKQLLIQKGYKMIENTNTYSQIYWVFANDNNIKLNFDKSFDGKYLFSNKLNF